jgi:hypothetical protein
MGITALHWCGALFMAAGDLDLGFRIEDFFRAVSGL